MLKDIGKRIKERREELGITQSELADRLGYKSKSSINKIELGVQNLRQSKIKDIADALKTTPAYIMGWEQADYYTSDEAAEVAQRLFENRELRMLFDAAKDASAEDLKTTAELLRILKSKEKADE